MNVKIDMFGCLKTFDWLFYLEQTCKRLDILKELVKEPQTLSYEGIDFLNFSKEDETEGYIFYYQDSDTTIRCDNIVRWALNQVGWDRVHYCQAILDNSTEDKEWTKWRNRDYNSIYYRKITLSTELQSLIITEANRIQEVIRKVIADEKAAIKAKEEKEAAEKAALLNGVKWDLKEIKITDEGGRTSEYVHTLVINGNSFIIRERNIFDFGRVMNAPKGGMYSRIDGKWTVEHFRTGEGWMPTEIQTDEQRAAEIVWKYGKFAHSGIRM